MFDFEFDANLGPGSYSIQTALHSTDTHLVNNYEWRDLALVFNVVNMDKIFFEGCSWLEPQIKVFECGVPNTDDLLALREVNNERRFFTVLSKTSIVALGILFWLGWRRTGPFFMPIVDLYSLPQAIDLGCGRGEWLELLRDEGFVPTGVDLDDGMLQACIERGLSVSHEDALTALESSDDESQAVVSAFHVVEHIPFEQLRLLVAEALRVLKPGGPF